MFYREVRMLADFPAAVMLAEEYVTVYVVIGDLIASQIALKGEFVRLGHQRMGSFLCAPRNDGTGVGGEKNACPKYQAHKTKRTGNYEIKDDLRSPWLVFALTPHQRRCEEKT